MTDKRAMAALIGGVGLLERAINYTLGSLHTVTPEAMSRPTPCEGWDLRALLRHMDESLRTLCEATDTGHVDLAARDDDDQTADPVARLRNRACRLLGGWAAGRHGVISIGGSPLTGGIVTSTGAIEVAVHGWDVAMACGHPRPIPADLADEMLELSYLFITNVDRRGHFAQPVAVSPLAPAGDRLVAFLGRDPHWTFSADAPVVPPAA